MIAFTTEQLEVIDRIIRQGNTVELKKVAGQIVIVEIRRQVKNKTSV